MNHDATCAHCFQPDRSGEPSTRPPRSRQFAASSREPTRALSFAPSRRPDPRFVSQSPRACTMIPRPERRPPDIQILRAALRAGGWCRSMNAMVSPRGTWTGRGVWMPAIWRPNVSGPLPDVDVEVEVTEDASSKGTKRKRAPPTKGPCEHGVKPRSNCKVCSGCPHGKWRQLCKECGGASICEHGRERFKCKECGGASICEHARRRSRCKECGGASICEHGRQRFRCKECGGAGICEHGRQRSICKECRAAH